MTKTSVTEFADKTKLPPPKLLVGNKCDLVRIHDYTCSRYMCTELIKTNPAKFRELQTRQDRMVVQIGRTRYAQLCILNYVVNAPGLNWERVLLGAFTKKTTFLPGVCCKRKFVSKRTYQ